MLDAESHLLGLGAFSALVSVRFVGHAWMLDAESQLVGLLCSRALISSS
jgi:hypothetical protein